MYDWVCVNMEKFPEKSDTIAEARSVRRFKVKLFSALVLWKKHVGL